MTQLKHHLPDKAYVTLSEALTWIAFGDALTTDELRSRVVGLSPTDRGGTEEGLRRFFANEREPEVLGTSYFENRDLGLEQLSAAWQSIREEAGNGAVILRGRYTSLYSLVDAHLAADQDLNINLLRTFTQFDVSTGGIRRQPIKSPDVLWPNHSSSFEREFEAFADGDRAADGYLLVEVERESLVKKFAPIWTPAVNERYSNAVQWCRDWIESGNGNGMDPAWAAFKAEPNHAGLSRDNVFRPAWKEAKTTQIRE